MQPTNNQQSKTQKAFTLIELLVVIAIIGILAGMVVVNMSGATESARVAKAKAFSSSVRSSLLMNRVSEWKFDDGLGTAAADVLGENTGTLINGPAWIFGADCVSEGCLQLDGTNDAVSLVEPPAESTNINTGSFFAWIKTSDAGSSYRGIAVKQMAYGIFLLDNVFVAYAWGGSSGARSTNINLADNTYHLVGMTFEGIDASSPSNNFKLYIDGELKLVSTLKASNQSEGLVFGSGANPPNTQSFKGIIDESRLYNSVLPASAVRSQYLAGIEKLYAGGRITIDEYQQRLSKLNSTYATSE